MVEGRPGTKSPPKGKWQRGGARTKGGAGGVKDAVRAARERAKLKARKPASRPEELPLTVQEQEEAEDREPEQPKEAEADAVCFVRSPSGVGSGFLALLGDLPCLVTTAHLIPSPEEAEAATAYLHLTGRKASQGRDVALRPRDIFYSSPEPLRGHPPDLHALDYAVVGVSNPPRGIHLIRLRRCDPESIHGRRVVIWQQPQGGHKVRTKGKITKVRGVRCLYAASTEPGSSGAPVLEYKAKGAGAGEEEVGGLPLPPRSPSRAGGEHRKPPDRGLGSAHSPVDALLAGGRTAIGVGRPPVSGSGSEGPPGGGGGAREPSREESRVSSRGGGMGSRASVRFDDGPTLAIGRGDHLAPALALDAVREAARDIFGSDDGGSVHDPFDFAPEPGALKAGGGGNSVGRGTASSAFSGPSENGAGLPGGGGDGGGRRVVAMHRAGAPGEDSEGVLIDRILDDIAELRAIEEVRSSVHLGPYHAQPVLTRALGGASPRAQVAGLQGLLELARGSPAGARGIVEEGLVAAAIDAMRRGGGDEHLQAIGCELLAELGDLVGGADAGTGSVIAAAIEGAGGVGAVASAIDAFPVSPRLLEHGMRALTSLVVRWGSPGSSGAAEALAVRVRPVMAKNSDLVGVVLEGLRAVGALAVLQDPRPGDGGGQGPHYSQWMAEDGVHGAVFAGTRAHRHVREVQLLGLRALANMACASRAAREAILWQAAAEVTDITDNFSDAALEGEPFRLMAILEQP